MLPNGMVKDLVTVRPEAERLSQASTRRSGERLLADTAAVSVFPPHADWRRLWTHPARPQ